jgi:hypothetical protein
MSYRPASLIVHNSSGHEAWTSADEGPGTWSPYVVIGHLIHADREARLRQTDKKSSPPCWANSEIRAVTVSTALRAVHLSPAQLELSGRHLALGLVTSDNFWRRGPCTIWLRAAPRPLAIDLVVASTELSHRPHRRRDSGLAHTSDA